VITEHHRVSLLHVDGPVFKKTPDKETDLCGVEPIGGDAVAVE
jgi:hypothetical protein